jgi:hypothetical protein
LFGQVNIQTANKAHFYQSLLIRTPHERTGRKQAVKTCAGGTIEEIFIPRYAKRNDLLFRTRNYLLAAFAAATILSKRPFVALFAGHELHELPRNFRLLAAATATIGVNS